MTTVVRPSTIQYSQNAHPELQIQNSQLKSKRLDPEIPSQSVRKSNSIATKEMADTAVATKSAQPPKSRTDAQNWDKKNDKSKNLREKKEQRIGDFVIKSTLGKGTFSKVCMAEHRITKQTFALKFIKPKSADSNSSNDKHSLRIEREIKLLSLLYHPNIVRLYDVVQTSKFTMIVMEHNSGGELLHYIRKRGRLMEREARLFFRQIVSAVDYCHRNCIIHRDLKLENVMLDGERRVRLIDFGFANTFNWDKELDTFCGSPFYAAPEMVNGIKYTGPEVDIWSMGVILFFMLCGRTPFEGENLKEIYDKISKGRFVMPQFLSATACDLLQRMLTVNPKKRINMAEVRNHAWINTDYEENINSYVPARSAVVLDPNTQSLGKMHLYGFTQEKVITALSDSDQVSTPIVCIYHLVDESRRRKAAKAARKSQALAQSQAKIQSQLGSAGANTNPSGLPQITSNNISIPGINGSPLTLVSQENNVPSENATTAQPGNRISLPGHDLRPGNFTSNVSVSGGRKLSMYSISQDIRDINEVEGSKTPAFLDSPSMMASQFGAGLHISKGQKSGDVRPTTGDSFNWESTSVRDSEVNSSRISRHFKSPSKLFAKLRKSMPFLKFRKSMAFIDPKPLQNNASPGNMKNGKQSIMQAQNSTDPRFSIQPPVPITPTPKTKQMPKSKASFSSNQKSTTPNINTQLSRTLSAHVPQENNQKKSPPSRRNTEFLVPANVPTSPYLPPIPSSNHWLEREPRQRALTNATNKSLTPSHSNMEQNITDNQMASNQYNQARTSNNHNIQSKRSIGNKNDTTLLNEYRPDGRRVSTPPKDRSPNLGQSTAPISGIFTIKTTILCPLQEIHQDLDRVLQMHAIAYRRITEYFFYCEDRSEFSSSGVSSPTTQSGNKFEIHITNIQGNLYTIKFKRLKGSWWTHKKLSQRLIKDMGN
ncbi:hypothetical protein BB558_007404 [Smittium angustum]|uniref:non-specific serine/threonine protein kinase n=1 Tax=Smittium angustum TaxID=133377 RepID=A0A2U1IV32_SMIAN|nr:hypothetical protein BB558_007404 [Smittium angustum]